MKAGALRLKDTSAPINLIAFGHAIRIFILNPPDRTRAGITNVNVKFKQ
jgi:hypothetical protein